MASAEAMRSTVGNLLRGIDRYNPENLPTLEKYVNMQVLENYYDLEANLAVLKLYQFNPRLFQFGVTAQILLKALTNLPHSDFLVCKCLIDVNRLEEETGPLHRIVQIANCLELCYFKEFWSQLNDYSDLIQGVTGFEDSIRKYICHVVGITYESISIDQLMEFLGGIPESQARLWTAKYGWKDAEDMPGLIFIANQDEIIKTKNIKEKITFESVAGIMAKVAVPR